MTCAITKTLAWIYDNPPEELARVVTGFFPDLPPDVLVASLRRYRDAGLWSRKTRMNPQGFARLAQSLQSGGLITRTARYDECVEPFLSNIRSGPEP
jgi:NitT/TauT family transport system substrate-binding protein